MADDHLTVIASDADEARALSEGAGAVPGLRVRQGAGTLTQMNGTAVAMANAPGILLVRLGRDDRAEVDTACRLASAPTTRASILVVGEADLPLSITRQLLGAGVADVLPSPVDPEDLRKAIQRAQKPANLPAVYTNRPLGRIITVARARGGIGASTVAVNLADALRRPAARRMSARTVALVDLDLQFGTLASFLDVEPRDTLWDIAAGGAVPDEDTLDAEMTTAANGVRVLSAPSRFAPLDALRPEAVGALLDTLVKRHDFVIVDLPHSLVDWVQAVIERTDRMIMVSDSSVPSIRQSKRLIDFFTEENPTLQIEVVINQEAKPLIRGAHHRQAAKLLERSFENWLPPDARVAREALDRGVPLSVVARRSALTRSIGRLAAATAAHLSQAGAADRSRSPAKR
ncbi:AAA family ATPase [Wenxinia marina]|uniref:AAA domain protein n=1 Tax=Wenxinia marina DSM 24838 TaxID=1123501 RepID=A0A0D0PD70_9RHOB|nr:AAA family ATPase [Wenxinia marina]KIQ69421.1 AAA domain protein [Wenxinia marina DSM 24838]GGL58190.1 pilus assembly protein CpaE [Wenxinia marina]